MKSTLWVNTDDVTQAFKQIEKIIDSLQLEPDKYFDIHYKVSLLEQTLMADSKSQEDIK